MTRHGSRHIGHTPAGSPTRGPLPGPPSRLHAGRRRGAGARHRRHDGRLLHRQRRAAETGAVPRSRAHRLAAGRLSGGPQSGRFAGEVRLVAHPDRGAPARRRLPRRPHQRHGRRRARAASLGPGVGRLLPALRRPDRAGARLRAQGGPAQRTTGGSYQRAPVGTALRSRSGRHRPHPLAERRATRRRRGRGRPLRVPRLRRRARRLDAVPARPERHGPGPLLHRRRPPEPRRLAGAGAVDAGALDRGVPGAIPGRHPGRRGLRRRADPRDAGPQRPYPPPGAARSGRLRPVDRVRQRGQSAARAGPGTQAGDRAQNRPGRCP